MPPGSAIRYDIPASELSELVSGYAIYGTSSREPVHNWFLPAPAMICVLIDAGPVEVAIRNHRFLPTAVSLYGPTSRAFRLTTSGGIHVGVGLSAIGWTRLFATSASALHNRVAPLATLVDPALVHTLTTKLADVRDEAEIGPTVDQLLAPLFNNRHPYEDAIRSFTDLMLVDGVIDVADAADRLSLPATTLRRIAIQAFGMPPKLLLRRARFLRSFINLLRAPEPMAFNQIDSTYFDASHFLRDANTFLGTTPRRFMAQDTTFMSASLIARAAVIGAPMQALHMVKP